MVSFLNDIFPYLIGGIVGYFYPVECVMKDKWNILQFLMVCIWIWALTRPIVIVLYMFGVR